MILHFSHPFYYTLTVPKYSFDEHGVGYKVGRKLQKWRPQFSTIVDWIKPESSVLDVGSGDGVLAERLEKEKHCTVLAVDLDGMAVRETKRSGIKAQRLDVDDGLPFKDNSFDVAVCSDLLQYVKKPDFVMGEILRIGKSTIVQFPNFGFWFYRLVFLTGRFPKLALYGHKWWESQITRNFTLEDFLRLPSLKNAFVKRMICIDWKNRNISLLARFWPNFFARSCILELSKKKRIAA